MAKIIDESEIRSSVESRNPPHLLAPFELNRAIAPSKRSLNINKVIKIVPMKKLPREKKSIALITVKSAPHAVTTFGVTPIRSRNRATGEIILVTAGFRTSLIIGYIVG